MLLLLAPSVEVFDFILVPLAARRLLRIVARSLPMVPPLFMVPLFMLPLLMVPLFIVPVLGVCDMVPGVVVLVPDDMVPGVV